MYRTLNLLQVSSLHIRKERVFFRAEDPFYVGLVHIHSSFTEIRAVRAAKELKVVINRHQPW